MRLRHYFWLDAAVLLVGGFLFWGYGPMLLPQFGIERAWWPSDLMLWRSAAFARLFGGALMSMGIAALGVGASRESLWHRATCPYFFGAHVWLALSALGQQQAVWDAPGGSALCWGLALLSCGFGYFWLAQTQGGVKTSSDELRSQWEQHVREAAAQEERNRLARDLHDSIKQQLYAIQAHLATAQAREDDSESVVLAREATRNAMTEMNAMLDQLRASPLEATGMVEALRLQCEALGHRTGAQVKVEFGRLPANSRFSPGTQLEVFRIAQEALSNVARHARATEVSLALGLDDSNDLRLTISDNGRGFWPHGEHAGMGLPNMTARATGIGGRLDIRSGPPGGCVVALHVPLASREAMRHQSIMLRALVCCVILAILLTWDGVRGLVMPLGVLAAATAIYHGIAMARTKAV